MRLVYHRTCDQSFIAEVSRHPLPKENKTKTKEKTKQNKNRMKNKKHRPSTPPSLPCLHCPSPNEGVVQTPMGVIDKVVLSAK